MGNTLKEESDREEREKIDAKLEGLAGHFLKLHTTAQERMKGMGKRESKVIILIILKLLP